MKNMSEEDLNKKADDIITRFNILRKEAEELGLISPSNSSSAKAESLNKGKY